MTTVLVTASPKSTIREVASTLSDNSFHSLVDEDGNLSGIVTSTDLINIFASRINLDG